jgi:hypothetical protein
LEDFLLIDNLPKHPDIGGEWIEYVEGSRDDVIKEIWGLVGSAQGRDLLLWIHGLAGLGKSTLARLLKDEAQSLNRLAAAIFLSRLQIDTWGLETFIRLIAGEIGRTHSKAIPMITQAIRQSHGAPLRVQVERFIRDPILALQLPYPLIVILDAAEEWKYFPRFVEQLEHLTPYSSVVKFVILGRSEPREGRYKNVSVRSYKLGPVSAEFMAGYLNDSFDAIEWKGGGKPMPEDVLRLAAVADGSFTRMEEVVCTIRDLPPSNYGDISEPIFAMALSAWDSSKRTGMVDEVDRSILLNRVALALRPPGHPERHLSLSHLAVSLVKRYKQSKSAEDLEEAILLNSEALALRPPGHPSRHYSCSNLANSLYDRFLKDGLVDDLDEAIALGREALSLRPKGHELRFDTMNELRLYLYDRFKTKGEVEDLQEAITLAEEAARIRPTDSPYGTNLPASISYYKAKLARAVAGQGSLA